MYGFIFDTGQITNIVNMVNMENQYGNASITQHISVTVKVS